MTHALHHLIPVREINCILERFFNLIIPVEEKKCAIENFLNVHHVKKVILGDNFFKKNVLLEEKSKHGKIIHKAFVFNAQNLFSGPIPKQRTHDPIKLNKSNHFYKNESNELFLLNDSDLLHDLEILFAQNSDYQIAYRVYLANKSIENFGNLVQNKEVRWVLSKNEEYCVDYDV